MTARIAAAYEVPYTRHPSPNSSTERLLAQAARGVVSEAGMEPGSVDGLGVSSFSLQPDHAIDLAWRLGLHLNWIMEDPHGGASGLNLLQHAVRAVEAGDARNILLLAGDHLDSAAFTRLARAYNRATAESLAPLGYHGPNPLFAMLTQRHMRAHDLDETDYAQVPLAQRGWARRNPHAVYRTPMTLADYLQAPMVAPPLRRYDCVPVVSGANALLVTSDEILEGHAVRVRATVSSFNHDNQQQDGLSTGLQLVAHRLWERAGLGPNDIDLACVYDDYPVMVLTQLTDLGVVEPSELQRFLHERVGTRRWPLNTSGGQLSTGQAGAAGGMHGLVEATRQLVGRADRRQVPSARHALVTGYGMVAYRHGACANAAILEGVG
ncbi:MAG TPA: thiolase family protein [Nocardioidaceae bacterium]|nr:thiolase family protein [Nocardioidaceae bacterium]